MKKIAIIVAAGSGTRMGSTLPKQFMTLAGKPLLYYTLQTFLKSYSDMQVILVLPEEYTDMGREIVDAWFEKERVQFAIGGDTRFQSVKNGLALVEDEAIIFIHDGVRCLVTEELIHRCYRQALDLGTAIPSITSRDSVRRLMEDGNEAIPRDEIQLIQTPQTFHSKILIPAFAIDFKERFTDEASVVEAYGLRVSLVTGETTNIKITEPSDMLMAEAIMQSREQQPTSFQPSE